MKLEALRERCDLSTATKLRIFWLDCPGAAWSRLELADALHVSETSIAKGLRKLRVWYVVHEEEQHCAPHLRGQMPPRRWIFPLGTVVHPVHVPGGGHLLFLISGGEDPAHADRAGGSAGPDQSGEGTPAPPPPPPDRTRTADPEDHRTPVDPHARARARNAGRGAPAFRANRNERRAEGERLGRAGPPVRGPDPIMVPTWIVLPSALAAAIQLRHGAPALAAVRRELRRPRCQARPEEALRAARTMPFRASHAPLRLFRGLFKLACRGELLIDQHEDAARTHAAELEQRRIALGFRVLEEDLARLSDEELAHYKLHVESCFASTATDPERAELIDSEIRRVALAMRERPEAERLAAAIYDDAEVDRVPELDPEPFARPPPPRAPPPPIIGPDELAEMDAYFAAKFGDADPT